jgi:hypothetical protein
LPSTSTDSGTSMPTESGEESISSMKLTKPGQLRSFAAYPRCSTTRGAGGRRRNPGVGQVAADAAAWVAGNAPSSLAERRWCGSHGSRRNDRAAPRLWPVGFGRVGFSALGVARRSSTYVRDRYGRVGDGVVEQGVEADEAKRIGASQLNSGVGRTSFKATGPREDGEGCGNVPNVVSAKRSAGCSDRP